ncbi:hypothetical protein IPC1362_29380 [Pseudomonas aeruginosa]|nr:hypothetical protein EJ593_30025 [Pseudomonas aeruginosa]RTC36279.1 hypothetical protein EJ782_08210 [Pseudomonas aeruginosa]RTC51680.1 hypothetical protein EJ815_27115 [Pseudomonas aeruginosa]RUD74724.1 hypothetical protein IPC1362_29380 [Pseudomonas aeruginosa]
MALFALPSAAQPQPRQGARPAPSIKPWRRANNRIAVIRRLCRAAADNAAGVIRPTVRSTAPASAGRPPGTVDQTVA